MLTIVLIVAGGAILVVLVLLALVVIGIKQEPQAEELTSRPPNATTAWVRHFLGVYMRKPGQLSAENAREEPCLAPWKPPRWPEGPTG